MEVDTQDIHHDATHPGTNVPHSDAKKNWKEKGSLNPGNDGYHSITGGGIYHFPKTWEVAREISLILGRLLPDIMKVMREYMAESAEKGKASTRRRCRRSGRD